MPFDEFKKMVIDSIDQGKDKGRKFGRTQHRRSIVFLRKPQYTLKCETGSFLFFFKDSELHALVK